MLLNGEFAEVPILASYASNEGLAVELVNRRLVNSGEKAIKLPTKPEEAIPLTIQKEISNTDFEIICSEMKEVYNNESSDKVPYLVSTYIQEYFLKVQILPDTC